jgi:hypothetical protein
MYTMKKYNSAQALASGIRRADTFLEDIREILTRIAKEESIGKSSGPGFLTHIMGPWTLRKPTYSGDRPGAFAFIGAWILEYRDVEVISETRKFCTPPLTLIVPMYQDLETLVDEMKRRFPSLAQNLQPFFDAAEV